MKLLRMLSPGLLFLMLISVVGLALAGTLQDCLSRHADDIAVLDWRERSDWINVRSDVSPVATGDGETDDTAAILTALMRLGPAPGDPKVIYFPPGTYRISDTLSASRLAGIMLVGHGRDTVIEWHGQQNGVMFRSNGLHRSVYRGLHWDGRGVAAVGIDHRSEQRYETHILHEYSRFSRFTESGIRVGFRQEVASAEIYYRQLKFDRNAHGVALLSWNDYNNVFDGVHFSDNEFGIAAYKGNFVVRNSRFQRSGQSDLLVSAHAYSARRVVSIGSNQFLRTQRGRTHSNFVGQDLYVRNWAPERAAIHAQMRGPLFLFDSLFDNDDGEAQALSLKNSQHSLQKVLIANVVFNGRDMSDGNAITAPIRYVERDRQLPLVYGDSHFLRSSVAMSQILIDVKQDCGAHGDNHHNDTRAIAECIDRAPTGAMLYFPSGTYRISDTLSLADKRLNLSGSGFHSVLNWVGQPGGPLLDITSPQQVSLTDLNLASDEHVTRLSWHGNAAGTLALHNVFGWLSDTNQKNAFVLRGGHPDATFRAGFLNGNVRIEGTATSDLFINYSISPLLEVTKFGDDDSVPQIASRVSCCNRFPLVVENNASLVMTDWYNEQSTHLFSASGQAATGAAKLVLDLKKAESEGDTAFTVAGYRGTVSLTGGFFGNWNNKTPLKATLDVSEKASLVLLANMFRHATPALCQEQRACIRLGNIVQSEDPQHDVPDKYDTSDTLLVNATLDAYRTLATTDLTLNYCTTSDLPW